jgi:hypothetical protein
MPKHEDDKKPAKTPYDRPMKAIQEEQPSGFLSNFTPSNGDLVYGRSDATSSNQIDLAKARQLREKYEGKNVPEKIWKTFIAGAETKDARFLYAKQYSESIQKSRFNPDTVPSTDASKQGEAINQTLLAESKAYAGLYRALRRGCKFGIGMIASEQIFAEAKVHFVLDLIDMTTVCGKRSEPVLRVEVENKIKTEPVICAELRYVFRNWAKLKT